MNNLIYHEDLQVFKIDAVKLYTYNSPRTEITIEKITQADIIKPIKKEIICPKNKFIPATRP